MKKAPSKKQPDLFFKSNAQRQKEYRERQKDKQSARLDMYIDKDIYLMLEQIANAENQSLKETLSNLIKKEHKSLNPK